MLSDYKVFAALHSEARDGWVWLPSTANLAGAVIRIRNPRNNRSIVCERRSVDTNFRQTYGAGGGTLPLPDGGGFVVISDWYRRLLGILDTKIDIPLEIEDADGIWAKYVSLFIQHPSPVVRTSIVLALVSFALGVSGLALGILSVCLALK